jgi:hypothetical protein
MNGRVAVLCPSRDRPEELEALVQSVLTTSNADILVYIDQDQQDLYPNVFSAEAPKQVRYLCAPRVGPVGSANALVKQFGDYDLYGLITDDSVLTTPHWDEWALAATEQFPNRICVISPFHNQGNHVDMPFVTRGWIDAVGWFACPDCHHYCWPIITGLIGEMTAIVHTPRHSFGIYHPPKVELVSEAALSHDKAAFFDFVALKLPPLVDKVREAMSA